MSAAILHEKARQTDSRNVEPQPPAEDAAEKARQLRSIVISGHLNDEPAENAATPPPIQQEPA
jgi:hypothetical protein